MSIDKTKKIFHIGKIVFGGIGISLGMAAVFTHFAPIGVAALFFGATALASDVILDKNSPDDYNFDNKIQKAISQALESIGVGADSLLDTLRATENIGLVNDLRDFAQRVLSTEASVDILFARIDDSKALEASPDALGECAVEDMQ